MRRASSGQRRPVALPRATSAGPASVADGWAASAFAHDQRAALTRPAAPPVERLLVDRAVACWLQLQYFTAVEANAVSAGEPPRLLQFRARRQAQAQRRRETADEYRDRYEHKKEEESDDSGDRPTLEQLRRSRKKRRKQPIPPLQPEGVVGHFVELRALGG